MLCPETLGKGFAEGCLWQRPLEEFLDGEGVFAEGQDGPRQRKEAVTRRRRWRFYLPRADPRQRNGFFLNFFCRGPALGKEFFFKSLPRASSLVLGKEIFRIFPKKPLPRAIARALGKGFFLKKNCLPRAGPRQRNSFFFNFFLKNLCRGPAPWPSAKKFS